MSRFSSHTRLGKTNALDAFLPANHAYSMIKGFNRLPSGSTARLPRLLVAACAMVATIMLLPASVQGAPPPHKVATVEGISEYDFDNGLRVLLYPDDSQSKFTVNLTALVGSRQEGYGETGMAHLLEHMLFKGTPNHPAVPKALEDHGAQFNGSTSSDRVNYFETLAASDANLEFAIDLEADRLMNSYVKKSDLDSEMTVVRNEFERGENSPANVLEERVQAAAYNWHNYGKPTIGNRTDIERVPIENLQRFYKKYYQPDNVMLIIAGKFSETNALNLVTRYFGDIPRPTRQLDATWTEEPPQDGERQVTLRRVGDLSRVAVAYHIPAGSHEDNAALQVLAGILRTQPAGRLYKALVETKKATSAGADAERQHDPSLFWIDAEIPADGSLDEVRNLLINTTEVIGSTGVTAEEVNRARHQILAARDRAANDTAQMGVALSEWAAEGDWRLFFLNRDRLEQVTPEKVQAVAAKYLVRNNRTVGIFIPTDKPERVVVPPTPEIASLVANYQGRAAISAGENFDPSPDKIEARVQRLELPEGIKATLLPKKSRGGEVRLSLTLRYGDEHSLQGMEAAAGFLPELMLRGTRTLTYQQFRDKLDQLEATLNSGGGRGGRLGAGGAAGPGSASFSIEARRDTLPEVLELLRQTLREPAMPPNQFEVMKGERLAGLEQMKTEPSMIAPRILERTLAPYATNDIRYTPTIDESIERLKATTYEQVQVLYHQYLGSQAGELTIVGDFDPAACLPILTNTFAGWRAEKHYARIGYPPAHAVPPTQSKVNTPDKANATFNAGLIFPLRDDDPDYPALAMANHIFGGGTLSSRLGVRVRQKEGLSYGITSSLSVSAEDQRSLFIISAIVNPKNAAKLQASALDELDKLLRDGITNEELDKAREGYLQARRVARSSDGGLVGSLGNLRHYNRTMQWEADFEKKISALTAEEINAAVKRHIDSKQLVMVSAGDFETVTAEKTPVQP